MKNSSKLAFAMASAVALASTANAAYVTGDLLVGFTGAANDYVYDLGQFSSVTAGETWNVGSYFGTSALGGQFGVLGNSSATSHAIYATSSDPGELGFVQSGTGQFNQGKANIATLASGSLTVGNGTTIAPSSSTSWFYQTAQPAGTPGVTFQNNYFNPNATVGSPAYFFVNTTGATTADGEFNYNSSSGILTFTATAVPEPGTYGMIAGVGLLALALRRQFVNAQ